MKLSNPRFLSNGGEGVTMNGQPVPLREGVGLTFDCPCGSSTCSPVSVCFSNPLDGGQAMPGNTWDRTGDQLESITLSPSLQRMDNCRAHFYVRNGAIEPA